MAVLLRGDRKEARSRMPCVWWLHLFLVWCSQLCVFTPLASVSSGHLCISLYCFFPVHIPCLTPCIQLVCLQQTPRSLWSLIVLSFCLSSFHLFVVSSPLCITPPILCPLTLVFLSLSVCLSVCCPPFGLYLVRPLSLLIRVGIPSLLSASSSNLRSPVSPPWGPLHMN